MGTIKYLACASNLLPARRGARIEIRDIPGTIELSTWAPRFDKASGNGSRKCKLTAAAKQTADGVVDEISIDSQPRRDEIEGVGKGYVSAVISTLGCGETHVYLARASPIDRRLASYDCYHVFVLGGACCDDFPVDYGASIAAVKTPANQDAARTRAIFAITESKAR